MPVAAVALVFTAYAAARCDGIDLRYSRQISGGGEQGERISIATFATCRQVLNLE